VFDAVFTRGSAAFIPYVMAGDPDLETTSLILDALRDAGAALIELGIPYGDPLADGPTIAAAGQRALARGTRMGDAFELVARAQGNGSPPIVLFTYLNPVLQYGLERFAADARRTGAAGAIVPDAALEETGELRAVFARHELAMPLLVAPSTSPQRAARIAEASTGFVYVVSRLGVTGANQQRSFAPVREQIAMLRRLTGKPLAVGFGVSTANQVREIAAIADGVIVGSALIDAYASTGERAQSAAEDVAALARTLVAATGRTAAVDTTR
jgi:tryptophan synthase alpha chain